MINFEGKIQNNAKEKKEEFTVCFSKLHSINLDLCNNCLIQMYRKYF